MTDVKLLLPDGSQIQAHKFILAMKSPVFQTQFYGPFARKGIDSVTIENTNSDSFLRMVKWIYLSEADPEADIEDHLRLLQLAHYYLLPDLIECCNEYLCKAIDNNGISEDFVNALNKIPKVTIYEEVVNKWVYNAVNKLPELLTKNLWKKLNVYTKDRILKELQVTRWEGEFYDCFILMMNLTVEFGCNMSDWTHKLCKKLHTIVMARMEHKPTFNLLKFYQWLLDTWSNNLEISEQDYDGNADYMIIDDNAQNHDPILSPKIQDQDVQELRDVLLASIDTSITTSKRRIVPWPGVEMKQLWKTLDFANFYSINNLVDYCEIKLARYNSDNVDVWINRASESPQCKNLLQFNIMSWIQNDIFIPSEEEDDWIDWRDMTREALDEIHNVYQMMTKRKQRINEDEIVRSIFKFKQLNKKKMIEKKRKNKRQKKKYQNESIKRKNKNLL